MTLVYDIQKDAEKLKKLSLENTLINTKDLDKLIKLTLNLQEENKELRQHNVLLQKMLSSRTI